MPVLFLSCLFFPVLYFSVLLSFVLLFVIYVCPSLGHSLSDRTLHLAFLPNKNVFKKKLQNTHEACNPSVQMKSSFCPCAPTGQALVGPAAGSPHRIHLKAPNEGQQQAEDRDRIPGEKSFRPPASSFCFHHLCSARCFHPVQ